MHILELIDKKKQNIELSQEEIEYIVENYVSGEIKDYQMSSFLMSIYFNDMTDDELVYLTQAYVDSGDTINLEGIDKTIDKHSTGGVGDKTTLIIAPILASLGFNVAKLSGRGLGHTGGTVDKLEAFENFKTEISMDHFLNQVKDIHIAVAGQTQDLVVADKKIYALRDVTATVDSIPLIAASIMSKKIASGAHIIILDVKYGSGAFMKNVNDAEILAKRMVNIGNKMGRKCSALITNMDQQLGYAIGNSNENTEAVNFLKGDFIPDLKELVYEICAEALLIEKMCSTKEEAVLKIDEVINNNKAYEKFIEFLEGQNSSEAAIENMKKPKNIIELHSEEEGYVSKIDAVKLGDVARKLGAGRLTKDDVIDHGVGLDVYVKVGDLINEGDLVAAIYESDIKFDDDLRNEFNDAITISKEKVEKSKTVEKIIK